MVKQSSAILNSDQGSQYTCQLWIDTVLLLGAEVSHDGAARAIHNIMIERVWRSLKYENVYLSGYGQMREADKGISAYFDFYNTQRPHQSLDYKTPWEVVMKN